MSIPEILEYLDAHEIDYRLESNFCCGYIFYFLDGSVYPRRYYDTALEGLPNEMLAESVDHMIHRVSVPELIKDWRHRIEAEDIENLFKAVEDYLFNQQTKSHE